MARTHVLLVEDNAADIALARHALRERDVRISVATDGEMALDFLECAANDGPTIDLVLLDLKLPRKHGLEVLAEVRKNATLHAVPIVVLTSSQTPSDLRAAYALGARACFGKPSSGLDTLLGTVLDFFEMTTPAPTEVVEGGSADSSQSGGAPPSSRSSEEMLRLKRLADVVDSSSEAIISVSVEGTIATWNAAAERLYGYAAHQAVGRQLSIIIPPDRVSEFDGIMERLRQGAPVQRMRTVRQDRDGRELHVELSVSPIRNAAGDLVGKSAIARDVTHHSVAERRFQLAVESLPSAIVMTDASGEIVMVNAEAERMFGYPRSELVGSSVDRLVPPRLRSGHQERRAGYLDSPETRAMGAGRELFAVRKDGTEVPVEIGLNPITSEDGMFVLSSIVDVSERRQAEERFRLAVEAAPSGMVMVDASGAIVLLNAETERMFGYERGELIGQRVDLLIPERVRAEHVRHRGTFAREPEARTMGTGRDLYAVRKDGTEFPVEVGLNPIHTGEEFLVLSTIVDITARKTLQEAMHLQSAELARSNEDLEQFAYAASHDLQEPLRMVSSFTELLARDYAGQLDDTARQYIGFAQDGATRMRQLIRDLLAYSRVGSRGSEPVAFDAQTCVEGAMQSLAVARREAEAEIDVDVEARVLGDATQVEQLFLNLLSNALKFRTGAPRIRVQARLERERYLFSVQDNGIGIPPQHVERVFQMFERLHVRDAYPGTGLGLALCRRIVERHDGRLWVESDGQNGSTFWFTLPAAIGG